MKFHCSDLKKCIRHLIMNTYKYIMLIFSVLIITIVILLFMPIRIFSFGLVQKLSDYLINIQKVVLEYFFKKMDFALNC
jgi:hypothetical protein